MVCCWRREITKWTFKFAGPHPLWVQPQWEYKLSIGLSTLEISLIKFYLNEIFETSFTNFAIISCDVHNIWINEWIQLTVIHIGSSVHTRPGHVRTTYPFDNLNRLGLGSGFRKGYIFFKFYVFPDDSYLEDFKPFVFVPLPKPRRLRLLKFYVVRTWPGLVYTKHIHIQLKKKKFKKTYNIFRVLFVLLNFCHAFFMQFSQIFETLSMSIRIMPLGKFECTTVKRMC